MKCSHVVRVENYNKEVTDRIGFLTNDINNRNGYSSLKFKYP